MSMRERVIGGSFHLHHRDYGHPWAEQMVWGGEVVEDDLDGNALHHLDEVAGGVLRRQQAETPAGAGLDAIHTPSEASGAIGIDRDLDRLPRAYVSQLCLHEVGYHPDVVRHDCHQRLADVHVCASFNALTRHAPTDRGKDLRGGEIDGPLFDSGSCLLDLGVSEVGLRAAYRHLM